MNLCLRWLVVLVLTINAGLTAHAHKPSDAFLAIEPGEMTLSVALKDLDLVIESLDENQDRQITFGEFKAAQNEILAIVTKELSIQCDGTAMVLRWQLDTAQGSTALEKRNDGTYSRLKALFNCPLSGVIQMQYRLFENVDSSHRLLITNTLGSVEVVSATSPSEKFLALRSSITKTTTEGSLDQQASPVLKVSAMPTFFSFLSQGFLHLAVGWDHLAFILVLVLPFTLWKLQASNTSLDWLMCRRLLLVVSAFTVGHSLTLLLASLNLVSVSANWVEPSIALTIAISAALNLMPEFRTHRLWIPLVFGTIHGLGFSSVLTEMNISSTSKLSALSGFNIGIELGQIAFVIVWALLQYWLLRWQGYLRWIVMGGSAVLMMAAVALTIVRATSA
jgi:HupE / UreJ protein